MVTLGRGTSRAEMGRQGLALPLLLLAGCLGELLGTQVHGMAPLLAAPSVSSESFSQVCWRRGGGERRPSAGKARKVAHGSAATWALAWGKGLPWLF